MAVCLWVEAVGGARLLVMNGGEGDGLGVEEWRKAKEACSGGVKGEGKGRWWCAGFDAIAGGWCLNDGGEALIDC